MLRSYKEDNWGCEENGQLVVGSKPPFREDLSAEAEESALLEAVNRERLWRHSRLEMVQRVLW
jgi:hypothetical protein